MRFLVLLLFACASFVEPTYGTVNVKRVHTNVYEVEGTGYHMQVSPGCRLKDGWVHYTENEELIWERERCYVTMVYPSPPKDWEHEPTYR